MLAKIKSFLKRSSLPITIIVVPHAPIRPKKIDVPFFMVLFLLLLFLFGVLYTFSTAVRTFEYKRMKRLVEYYRGEFESLNETITSVKKTQNELAKLLSLKSKRKIIEAFDESEPNFVDIESIKKEIERTIKNTSEIKKYLKEERDRYFSTPMGWPVSGNITSPFGFREHPLTKSTSFHSGIDINVPEGTPVRATASGIVVYSGFSYGSGNVVVIEHGHSYTTLYAHNKRNLVKVGDRVKRGDIIALSGSTGDATGPHLHYEVWKAKKPVDPIRYLYFADHAFQR